MAAAPLCPISPELALVDRELADLGRDDALTYGPTVPSPTAAPTVPRAEPAPHGRRPRRAAVAILPIAVGAVLVLLLSRSVWQTGDPPTAITTESQPLPPPRAPSSDSTGDRRAAPAPVNAPLRHSVERQVLLRLPELTQGAVARRLVDPRSGIVRSNVAATCSASSTPHAFTCAIRGPSGRVVSTLSVVMRSDGQITLAPQSAAGR